MKRSVWFGLFMLVLLLCTTSALADGGTWNGITWDLTDGVFTLGVEGENQTSSMIYGFPSWPWNSVKNSIISIRCQGSVAIRGSARSMFGSCANLVSADMHNLDVSGVTDMEDMFRDCPKLESIDLRGWNTSNVTTTNSMFVSASSLQSIDVSHFDMSHVTTVEWMFYGTKSLSSLDLSGWNLSSLKYASWFLTDSHVQSLNLSSWDMSHILAMRSFFGNGNYLNEVILGEVNPFIGANGYVELPTPPSSKNGVLYTQKWIREDGTAGPYTSSELRANYTSSMAGKWVWERMPDEYTIKFVSSDSAHAGSMSDVKPYVSVDYTLPANGLYLFGSVFDHWEDVDGNSYSDQGVIPANTYEANAVVTLTAVFAPRNTSIQMRDGEFTFSIKGDEKAFFDSVPAGTSYSVFEENIPEDWVLIMQSDSTGVITSLKESEALFLNKYQPDMATMQFTGRKLMDGQPAEKDSFTFELWENDVLLQTKSVKEGGFVQFDILEYTRTDAGIHTYVIKELAGTDSALLYDGHEETIAVEVTTEESSDNVTRVHAEVTYSDGTYPDIVFQNWTKPGKLTLKKLVEDVLAGHGSDEFKFRIRFVQESGLPLSEELTYSIEP